MPVESSSGRGATRNDTPTRFNLNERVVEGEWLDQVEALDGVPKRRTTVTIEHPRSILTRNNSPDIGFDRSINAFRGCEHGCIYCFARPTHAYLGLSPGLDFESRLFAKPEAAALLDAELRAPSYRCRVMAMGTNTDPYQPIEREWQVTRQVIHVLSAFSHPLSMVTKSHLITRDIDILAPMARKRLFLACVSVTTLDRALARKMEPRAATPARRLEAVKALSDAGIPVMVMTAPIIPGLNDHEIETLAEAAADHGARGLGYVLLRMPLEIKELFREWLESEVPDRANRVLNLMRSMHHGKDYDSRWFERQRGHGPFAKLIEERVAKARTRFGLDKPIPPLDPGQFRVPPKSGDQLSLF